MYYEIAVFFKPITIGPLQLSHHMTEFSRLFIKLWAATLRIPEMEKACRKHQNGEDGEVTCEYL